MVPKLAMATRTRTRLEPASSCSDLIGLASVLICPSEPRVLRVVAQHRYPCTILGGQRPWLAAAISASSRAVCLRFWRGS